MSETCMWWPVNDSRASHPDLIADLSAQRAAIAARRLATAKIDSGSKLSLSTWACCCTTGLPCSKVKEVCTTLVGISQVAFDPWMIAIEIIESAANHLNAYLALDRDFDVPDRIVTEVFQAMIRARHEPTTAAALDRQSVRQSRQWWT